MSICSRSEESDFPQSRDVCRWIDAFPFLGVVRAHFGSIKKSAALHIAPGSLAAQNCYLRGPHRSACLADGPSVKRVPSSTKLELNQSSGLLSPRATTAAGAHGTLGGLATTSPCVVLLTEAVFPTIKTSRN